MENYSSNFRECNNGPVQVIYYTLCNTASASGPFYQNNGDLHSTVSGLQTEIQQKNCQLWNQQRQLEATQQQVVSLKNDKVALYQQKCYLEQKLSLGKTLLGKLAEKVRIERSQSAGLRNEVTKLRNDLVLCTDNFEAAKEEILANEYALNHCNKKLEKQIQSTQILEEKYEDSILDFAASTVELQEEVRLLKEERERLLQFVETVKKCARYHPSGNGDLPLENQLDHLTEFITNRFHQVDRRDVPTAVGETPRRHTPNAPSNVNVAPAPQQVDASEPPQDALFHELMNTVSRSLSGRGRKRAVQTMSQRRQGTLKKTALKDMRNRFRYRLDGREFFKCPTCGKLYKVFGCLRTHLKSHHDTTPSQSGNACGSCEKTFGSQVVDEEPCGHVAGNNIF